MKVYLLKIKTIPLAVIRGARLTIIASLLIFLPAASLSTPAPHITLDQMIEQSEFLALGKVIQVRMEEKAGADAHTSLKSVTAVLQCEATLNVIGRIKTGHLRAVQNRPPEVGLFIP